MAHLRHAVQLRVHQFEQATPSGAGSLAALARAGLPDAERDVQLREREQERGHTGEHHLSPCRHGQSGLQVHEEELPVERRVQRLVHGTQEDRRAGPRVSGRGPQEL